MKKWLFYLNLENIWLFFCSLSISGAIIYVVYALNIFGTILTIITALIITYFFKLKSHKLPYPQKLKEIKIDISSQKKRLNLFWVYISLSLSSIIAALLCLVNNRSDQALISPWSVLPLIFFILLFWVNIFTLLSLRASGKKIYKQILFGFYLFLIFSIAAIVYKLGYGFDPHIHYASLEEIIKTGFILPKTPYYLGQYSLIVIFYRIFSLSLNFLNTYLLAISAAIFIPFLLNYLQAKRKDIKSAWTASLLLILLGFSPFIVSTPQNFSYLFLLASIIFIYKNAKKTLIIASALASLAIHPIAGIPAVLIASFKILHGWPQKPYIIKIILKPVISGAIFLACLIIAIWSITAFSPINFSQLNLDLSWPQFPKQASYLLNLSYTFIYNQAWLIFGLSLLIILLKRKIWLNHRKIDRTNAKLLGYSSLIVLLAYLISSMMKFPSLISYEQDAYIKRLISVALIISLPLFWELFYYFNKKIKKITKSQKIILTIGVSLLLLVSIYGSYPRFDALYNSHGYSSSKNDLDSVLLAERIANGEKYIVLANQQVSAMALKEFGFHNRYFKKNNEEFYFYPIPTGAKLYQYFLDLSYKKADRDTIIQAIDYAGVNRAFLIVNRYWWASDKIIAEAKMSANNWYKIGQADNYVFEYKR